MLLLLLLMMMKLIFRCLQLHASVRLEDYRRGKRLGLCIEKLVSVWSIWRVCDVGSQSALVDKTVDFSKQLLVNDG